MKTHVDFFAPAQPLPKADILKLYALPEPVPGVRNVVCPTIIIDLSAAEDALWEAVDAKSRKVIRQAAREGIEIVPIRDVSAQIWDEFQAAYIKLRSRKSAADALGVGQIGELLARDMIVMSVSRDGDGNRLSWHSYVHAHGHVRLLNTVSQMDPARDTHWNNMVGRAHRLHHWKDILYFKQHGALSYDLGGVYRGTQDREQMNIARFKSSFGGYASQTYDAVMALTGKGRLALSVVARIGSELRSGGGEAGSLAR